MPVAQSFDGRASLPGTHPLTSYLCELIAAKKTNLCLSADVTSTSFLLKLAEDVGDYICVLKTHADIVDDFGERTVKGLKEISRRKKFLIFEDRKFGDIGNTVQSQYLRGPLRIADWAHMVNCHVFPGPAIVTALKQAGHKAIRGLSQSVSTEVYAGTPNASEHGEDEDEEQGEDEDEDEDEEDHKSRSNGRSNRKPEHMIPLGRKGSIVATTQISRTVELREGHRSPNRLRSPPNESALEEVDEGEDEIPEPPLQRGLLLLAEMSSEGNLMNDEYTKKCVEVAQANKDFVMGYISQRDLNGQEDNFLSMTPGVNSSAEESTHGVKGDAFGQQYRNPKKVILEEGCDIIIVGRGIVSAQDRAREAKRYRDEAWEAYQLRLKA